MDMCSFFSWSSVLASLIELILDLIWPVALARANILV
jgi:heme exporter protein D